MRTFLSSLFLSGFLVAAISAGVAWGLSAWLPFLATFGIIFVAIFVGMFIYNSNRERRMEVDQAAIYAKAELLDHRNTVVIECPCKNNSFEMQVFPNEVNEYTCETCKNKFYINMVIEPILKTEPINLDNAYNVFQALHEAVEADVDESRDFWNKVELPDEGTGVSSQ